MLEQPSTPLVVTLEVEQKAQMRMDAQCDCQPQVEVRYHTVPFGHADSFALEVMAEVLNGRTGRLYKAMVEGKEIASSASAGTDSRKYAGAFSFRAQVKGDADPPQLEEAWYDQLARLQEESVPQRELQKVKNRIAANAYRRLQSNFFLLIQLGLYEGLGGWEYLNESPAKLQAVTTDDITRIANTYFDKSNRAVATYTRKAGMEPQDADLAALDGPTRDRVQQQVSQLLKVRDLGRLQMMAAMMEGMMDQVPPDDQAAVKYVVKKIKERIAELESSTGN